MPMPKRLKANLLEGGKSSLMFLWMKVWNFFIENWGPTKYPPTKNAWLNISKMEGGSVNAFSFWSLLNSSSFLVPSCTNGNSEY